MHRKRRILLGLVAISILAVTTVAVSSAKTSGSGQTVVKVMTIGYPDQNTKDAVTGATVPGIGQLQSAFDKANRRSAADHQHPVGFGRAGATHPKTTAMVSGVTRACTEMPDAQTYGREGSSST